MLVEFVNQVSEVSSYLQQVNLRNLDLLRVLQINELRMCQDFEAPKELRRGELVWVNSFGPPDILVYHIKRLYEVVNLLEEILLTVFLHKVLLLLKRCG
jgi:hypothetical protein